MSIFIASFVIFLIWLLTGAGSFVLVYKFSEGRCPSRRLTFWATILGFVTVGASIIVFIAEAGDKMCRSEWWNKPVC
mgnify:CR=1 FL=1